MTSYDIFLLSQDDSVNKRVWSAVNTLNLADWSTKDSKITALSDLAESLPGTAYRIDGRAFGYSVCSEVIRRILPLLIRSTDPDREDLAILCESHPTKESMDILIKEQELAKTTRQAIIAASAAYKGNPPYESASLYAALDASMLFGDSALLLGADIVGTAIRECAHATNHTIQS